MGKIKIHEIAKKLGLTSKEILEVANKLNIEAKSHLSGVDEDEAKKIEEAASKKNVKKQDKVNGKVKMEQKEENKKEKNLGIETLLFKTKDIKNFINQLEIEQLVGEENKGKFDKKSNVDETILSNFDLAILLIMGITILIDFAI